MFESLSDRLSGIFDKLTRRGALTDSDVAEAMREVRRALIEADVALDVVKSGQAIQRNLQPSDLSGTILWLVADTSAFVTGQTISVDGGTVMN